MLLYVKGQETHSEKSADGGTSGWSGPREFAHYVPREFASSEVKGEYVVYPHKASYFVFHYGEEYRANDGMFRGNLNYGDICRLILKGAADLHGEGRARLQVGEGGKFHLTDFKPIYP